MHATSPLSERQAEILQALYDHESLAAAALALGVSLNTVKTGLRRIRAKYGGVEDRGRLYEMAVEDGYIKQG